MQQALACIATPSLTCIATPTTALFEHHKHLLHTHVKISSAGSAATQFPQQSRAQLSEEAQASLFPAAGHR
jgi:hypothetical protein